jgi:hypothetical protein
MKLQNFSNFSPQKKDDYDIDSLISGFEDLGINEKPKVWFFDYSCFGDGTHQRNILAIQAISEMDAKRMMMEYFKAGRPSNFSQKLGSDKGWENFLEFILEKANPALGMEVIDLVKEIPFPNPSRFKEGINNLVLYWSENQAIDCFHAMNDVEEYLRKKYNIGLEDFS